MDANEILARKLREAANEIEKPASIEPECDDLFEDERELDESLQRVRDSRGLELRRPEPTALEVMQEVQVITPWSKPGAPEALCHLCPLKERPCVPTKVPETRNGVVFVGEAPGAAEVARGEGFIGPSGRLLRQVYERAGGRFDEAIRTNTVLCRPPDNRDPTDTEIACCAPRLRYELDTLAPSRVVAVGRFAAKTLGDLAGIALQEGAWTKNFIAAPHPAFVLRQGSALPRLQRVMERVARPPSLGEQALLNPPEWTLITSLKQLQEVLSESIPYACWLSFDIETNQTSWFNRMFGTGEQARADTILCLLFTTGVGYGWVVPDYLLYDTPGVKEELNALFARVRTTAHNGKFDTLFLRSIGVNAHVDLDTIILHYTTEETQGTHGLKDLGAEEFGLPNYEDQLITRYLRSKSDSYSKIPEAALYQYGTWDVGTTMALAAKLKVRAKRQGLWDRPFQSLLMPANAALTNIEYRGVRVDIPYLQLWRDRLTKRAELIRRAIARYAGDPDFNPASPPQMQKLLFGRLGLQRPPELQSASGRSMIKPGSTGREALAWLRANAPHPVVDLLGEYRTVMKMLGSYIDNLLDYADTNGRVHTTYSLFGPVTGRLSSRNPALQQIPRGGSFYGRIIKAAFIASDGHVLIDCDYAQAELRVFAAVTGDPFLLNVYANDLDLHEEVMIAQFGPKELMDEYQRKQNRYISKVFNFGWAYGGGADMLAGLMPNQLAALEFAARYEQNMPVAAQWRRDQVELAKRQGYVENRFGRRRRNYLGSLGGPEAINSPIQSGASDCTLSAAIRLDREGYDVLLLVHDDTVTEVPEERGEEAQRYIEHVMIEEAAAVYPEVKWAADADPPKKRWMKAPSEEEVEQWLAKGTSEQFEE